MTATRTIWLFVFAGAFALATWVTARAQDTRTPDSVPLWHQVSGTLFEYQVSEDDTGDSLAARFGEPELTMLSDSDPEPGSTIAIDDRHVAPAVLDDGVVINVPQRMLFAFRAGRAVAAWPVTVGRPDWPTPLGRYSIASLTLNPTWHVPPAIRAEMEDDGIPVGAEVKPGPSNPLGHRWIGLDHGGIGIHATNHPRGIFNFGSHGCIRMAPEAARQLYQMVRRGDPVAIIYQPVTLALLANGEIFLESDADPYGHGRPDIGAIHAAARAAGIERRIDWARASRALVTVEGIARRIDRGEDSELARGAN